MQADPYQPAASAPTSASDGSVSDHDDEKPAAAAVVAGSSSEVKDGKDDVKDDKVKDEKDDDAKDDMDGDNDDDEEISPKRKRKAPVSEINEDLLEGDEKLKLEQRRAYNRACAAKVCRSLRISSSMLLHFMTVLCTLNRLLHLQWLLCFLSLFANDT
jgi:hypothetical protein